MAKRVHRGETPILALLYDFDKTLCTDDMQTYTFLPQLGLEAKPFWDEANAYTAQEGMDSVLAYMYTMLRKMRADTHDFTFKREDLCELGRDVQFFKGVETWFDRVNAFGAELGVEIQHYIISSGLREIIEGSKIAPYFKAIFASEFHYDRYGAPDWPLMAVNYTGKTQYLFRINKGILDISEDRALNSYMPEGKRPVPFRNMIYLGDGLTDVPCMKLVKEYGGVSIAVYTAESHAKIEALLKQKRVSYLFEADYSEGSALEQQVFQVLKKMALTDQLKREEERQLAQTTSRA